MDIRSRATRSTTVQQVATKPESKSSKEKKSSKRYLKSLLTVLVVLFFLYLLPPLLLRYSPWVRDAVIFVHHLKIPFFGNLSDPLTYGLTHARQFELYHGDGCSVEAWQILPKAYHSNEIDGSSSSANSYFIRALSDGQPIVIYLHGNGGTRAVGHRLNTYHYLTRDLGYHVITFDYRGYGDSECYPSERGMMEDGKIVWDWLKSVLNAAASPPADTPSPQIYIWGHSLGSAAASYLTEVLSNDGDLPTGLVLEAPFTDMIDEASNHPLSIPYRPIMSLFIHLTFGSFEDKFESVKRINHIRCPVLILHGKRDYVVPYHLGRKLYETGVEGRKRDPSLRDIEFVDCGETGHKNSWKSPNAKEALKRFLAQETT